MTYLLFVYEMSPKGCYRVLKAMLLKYEIIVGNIKEWKSNDEEPSEIMSSDFAYLLQCRVAVGGYGESY